MISQKSMGFAIIGALIGSIIFGSLESVLIGGLIGLAISFIR